MSHILYFTFYCFCYSFDSFETAQIRPYTSDIYAACHYHLVFQQFVIANAFVCHFTTHLQLCCHLVLASPLLIVCVLRLFFYCSLPADTILMVADLSLEFFQSCIHVATSSSFCTPFCRWGGCCTIFSCSFGFSAPEQVVFQGVGLGLEVGTWNLSFYMLSHCFTLLCGFVATLRFQPGHLV